MLKFTSKYNPKHFQNQVFPYRPLQLSKPQMNIFLFHRDLRLIDNTTLISQLKQVVSKSVTPIFIFPPEQINKDQNKYFCNNSVQFMIESLNELSQ